MAGSAQVFLAETPKTDGHAGTIKVGTNSVELQESHSVQASFSFRKFCKPRFGHACLVLFWEERQEKTG